MNINFKCYNSHLVANFILCQKNKTWTPLQINKLVYFCHGWMLGLYGRSLISEQVEAWEYGPIIPSIYYAFRGNGADIINFHDYFTDTFTDFDSDETNVIQQVINEYGDLSESKLVEVAYASDTPWEKYYDETRWNIVIPDKAIKDHFEKESKTIEESKIECKIS